MLVMSLSPWHLAHFTHATKVQVHPVANLLRQLGDDKVFCPHESGKAHFVKCVGRLNP